MSTSKHSKKLGFYYIDEDYLQSAHTVDNKVPLQSSEYKNAKFFCGVVLRVGDYNYFAPVSSKIKFKEANYVLMEKYKDENTKEIKQKPLSCINFSFMIPVHSKYVTPVNFKTDPMDESYRRLLKKEYRIMQQHKEYIFKRAERIYKLVCNDIYPFNKISCNFKLLEKELERYRKMDLIQQSKKSKDHSRKPE